MIKTEMDRFRGKRQIDGVEKLREISETDDNRVVRIHCLGAIKTIESK